MTLLSTTLTSDVEYFADKTCSRALYALSMTYAVVSVTPHAAELFAVDYRIQKIAMQAIAPAAALNRQEELNLQWRDGEPIDLSPSETERVAGYAYEPGMSIYDLLGLEGGTLHEGKYVNSHMALTTAERPLELNAGGFKRVKP